MVSQNQHLDLHNEPRQRQLLSRTFLHTSRVQHTVSPCLGLLEDSWHLLEDGWHSDSAVVLCQSAKDTNTHLYSGVGTWAYKGEGGVKSEALLVYEYDYMFLDISVHPCAWWVQMSAEVCVQSRELWPEDAKRRDMSSTHGLCAVCCMLALFCAHATWFGEKQEWDACSAQAPGLSCGLSSVFTMSKRCGPFCWCACKCSPSQDSAFLYILHLQPVFNPVGIFFLFFFFLCLCETSV